MIFTLVFLLHANHVRMWALPSWALAAIVSAEVKFGVS